MEIKFYFDKELAIELISQTFQKSFGRKFDKENWKWRYKGNPNEDKIYISYIVESNVLAAYYAVSPCIVQYNDKKYKIALSNMTMTHPDHQGKGYFKLLANKLYDKLKEDNFIGVYGFANSNSHYGFRKYLNWHDLAILNIFKLTPEIFRPFLIKDNNSYKFEESPLDQNTIGLLKSFKVSNKLIEINRNFNNYEWRFVKIPNQKYHLLILKEKDEIRFVMVYKLFENEIDLMEIFFKTYDETGFQIYLGNSIKYLISKYNKAINIWTNLYDNEHIYLEKIGFQESIFNTYFGIIPFVNDMEMLHIKNWHYRFFDSDIF